MKNKSTVVVHATAQCDETFVYQNNSKAKNPWLKPEEKAPEPSMYPEEDEGPLAALFRKAEPVKDDEPDIISARELSEFTKTGKLHAWLKKTHYAFEWDHEERCFWLTERREHRLKHTKKKARKGMRSLSDAKTEQIGYLDVAVAVYAYEGEYMFTDSSFTWCYCQSKNFAEFVRLFRELSNDILLRSL